MLNKKGTTGKEKDLKLSLCKKCMCMTYTVLRSGYIVCGKCKELKEIKCEECGISYIDYHYGYGLCDECFRRK